ncbi:transmembrane protein 269 isoform X2 [Emydura macquarii macquarii]|uniref:transmembrane protein 269 isoform X2 n=1 Tax=Emydura macquarii macquarii TaxID=1129001 RepID=UPI00352B24D7
MWMALPPSGIFHHIKKLFLSEQAGRAQALEFVRKNVANAISMANLIMGLSSILCSLNGQYHCACWLLLIGFLLDLADGAVARQLNACSALGAKLDDFADFTSFGLATALLLQAHGILDGLLAIVYVLAVFARLCFFSSAHSTLKTEKLVDNKSTLHHSWGLLTFGLSLTMARKRDMQYLKSTYRESLSCTEVCPVHMRLPS